MRLREPQVWHATVKKYLAAAISLGLSATGPPPTESVLLELRRLGVRATQPVHRSAPQVALLEPYRTQIATRLDQDQLLLNHQADAQPSGAGSRA